MSADPQASASSVPLARPRAMTVGSLTSLAEDGPSPSIFTHATPSSSFTSPSSVGSPSSSHALARSGRPLSAVALGKRRQDDSTAPLAEAGPSSPRQPRSRASTSAGGLENGEIEGRHSEVSLPANWSEDALSTSRPSSPSIRFASAHPSSASFGARGRQRSSNFLRSGAPSPEPSEDGHGAAASEVVSAVVSAPEPSRPRRSRTQSLSQLSFQLVVPKRLRRPSAARALSTPTGVQSSPVSPWSSSSRLSVAPSTAPSSSAASSTRPRGRFRMLLGRKPATGPPSSEQLAAPSRPTRPSSPAASVVRQIDPTDEPTTRSVSRTRPGRARSQSAPLLVAPSSDDTRPSTPVPAGIDWFDMLLPREVRLYIFASLLHVYVDEHEAAVAAGTWRGSIARDTRWTGLAAGRRNLIALTRVSQTWASLALDGQLWQKVDVPLLGADVFARGALMRIIRSAGPFITELNLRGLASLDPTGVFDVIEHCATYMPDTGHETGLVSLCLTGCHGIVTSPALNILLNCSPHLRHIDVAGLRAVTSSTCAIIAARHVKLVDLNVSNCPLLDAASLSEVVKGVPGIQKLRAARLKHMSDDVLVTLFTTLRQLVLLDISYSLGLTDAAFNRVASTLATSGDHRLPLKLLNVSGCRGLTSQTFKALTKHLPLLDTLEVGAIGAAIRDEGLVAFFASTPLIRRVDLGGAIEITDRTISALTAPTPGVLTSRPSKHGTGLVLEHLVLSGCAHISDRALVHLVRNCAKLRVVQLDNTSVGDAVVREFVRLTHRRKLLDAGLTAFDSRNVTHRVLNTTDEAHVRPRHGVRGFAHRAADYHEPDEYDRARVVLKTFFTLRKLDEQDRVRARRRAITAAASSGTVGRSNSEAGNSIGRPSWTRKLSFSSGGADDDRGACAVM